MAKPGPKKKPLLAVVREGNASKRPLPDGTVLPPPAAGSFPEPNWPELFPFPTRPSPAVRGELTRARNIARREWRKVVPVLVRSVGLADIDWTLTTDYCVCVARIDQGERALSKQGMLQLGERGWQKNGWTTILGQYRAQMKSYVGELGLSPSARTSLKPASGPDDPDDPFD